METSFLTLLGVITGVYLYWGMKRLPGERWQIAAAVPLHRDHDGSWAGLNLTWYGILTANAYVAAALIALILMGAVGVSLPAIAATTVLLLACCVPASRLVAQAVEGKANTFTVGGAVFVGTLLAPWIVTVVNLLPLGDQGGRVPVLPALAAICIAYAFGEGFGRLACVSFGCCYGKPLSSCHPTVARMLAPVALTFTGKTKKIAYASSLDGVKVVPIQGVTYLLYCSTGLGAISLYLAGHFGASFLLTLTVTQGWRFVSEFFRDDFRGLGRLSAYQWMGLIAIGYGCWATGHFGGDLPGADLAAGLNGVWNPVTLLSLQLLWLVIFLYTGVSRVTGATMNFHVNTDKV